MKYKTNEAFNVALQTLNGLDGTSSMTRKNSTNTFISSSDLKFKS